MKHSHHLQSTTPDAPTRASTPRLPRNAVWGALVMGSLCTLALGAWAGQQTRQMSVSATVQPYARLTVQQPAQLVSTAKDLALGYIELPNPSNPSGGTLSVRSNDRAGHTLIFSVPAAQQALYTSIQVNGLGQPLVLPPSGGQLSLPYSGPESHYTLSYRFNFAKVPPSLSSSKGRQVVAPALQMGSNPWPLSVTVQPN